MSFNHTPVLLDEVLEGFGINLRVSSVSKVSGVSRGIYIDGTIGGGGHTEEILKSGGKVLGLDQDQDAITHLKKKFESEIKQGSLILARGNFADIKTIAEERGIKNVDGILLDLGVSSYQLDSAGRGFSFRANEELDMRMDKQSSLTAGKIVNTYTLDELYEIFLKYGEEPKSRKFAEKIVQARKNTEIKTTTELVDILVGEQPSATGFGGIHPATRVFQALRIVVNDEIGNLKKGLDSGFKLLAGGVFENSTEDGGARQSSTIVRGGRLSVISFHSLEDRVVKLFFLQLEREGLGKIITKKPITASEEEIGRNRRSRSAKLRIIERIANN